MHFQLMMSLGSVGGVGGSFRGILDQSCKARIELGAQQVESDNSRGLTPWLVSNCFGCLAACSSSVQKRLAGSVRIKVRHR